MAPVRFLIRLFALSAALLAASAGHAQPQDRAFEQTYRAILPQEVTTGNRIEVIDFFWYG
jgi:hypothetical protein